MNVPAGMLETICREAEAEYPAECCGVVVGPEADPDRLSRVLPLRNAQDRYHARDPEAFPRTSRNAYFIEPADLLALERELGERGEVVRVIYHSHPDAAAYFSEEDQRQAMNGEEPLYPGAMYLVVPVSAGRAGGSKMYGWKAGMGWQLVEPGGIQA